MPHLEPLSIAVAGVTVNDPFDAVTKYAERYGDTLRRYDAAGPGAPNQLTMDEVARTRVIASRISNKEAGWIVERAASAPWDAVPLDARLVDADPDEQGGLYDAARALYDHFFGTPGISTAKVSKVLHLKRPHLYPVLDSRLVRRYRPAARRIGRTLTRTGAPSHTHWGAIRSDLLEPTNVEGIARLRAMIEAFPPGDELQRLSDVRLLDILAWKLG